jgi:hypothetical protein
MTPLPNADRTNSSPKNLHLLQTPGFDFLNLQDF